MASAAVVSPDRILRDLANLWVTLGNQGEPETGMGVLRACSLNLVVVADESDDFQALGETLAALMPAHPSRAIVIRLGAGNVELGARVLAQCWMPFGQRRQICCEQIEITAAETALEDALSVAAAVTAPDLPVIAWCRSPLLVERARFRSLARLANRVVVDSARFADAHSAIARLAELAGQGLVLGDLSWTRLTRWREMLSQAFECHSRQANLPAAVQVRVGFGGASAPAAARYLGAWIEESLRGAGVSASLSMAAEAGAAEGELSGAEMSGDGLRLGLFKSKGCLGVKMDGIDQCASHAAAPEYLLMQEELNVVGHDPVFERTLRAAAAL